MKNKMKRKWKRRKDGYIVSGNKNYNEQSILHPYPSFTVPTIGPLQMQPWRDYAPKTIYIYWNTSKHMAAH